VCIVVILYVFVVLRVCIVVFTLDAGLLAGIQYSEGQEFLVSLHRTLTIYLL